MMSERLISLFLNRAPVLAVTETMVSTVGAAVGAAAGLAGACVALPVGVWALGFTSGRFIVCLRLYPR